MIGLPLERVLPLLSRLLYFISPTGLLFLKKNVL